MNDGKITQEYVKLNDNHRRVAQLHSRRHDSAGPSTRTLAIVIILLLTISITLFYI